MFKKILSFVGFLLLLWVCKCFYYKIDIGLFLVSCKKPIDHHGSQKVKEVHCTYNT